MLPARAQRQAFRVSNETFDVVTGTESPLWEAAFLGYGTVCKTTTIGGSRASDAHAPGHISSMRRWLKERALKVMP
jgi:hypothetical protein